MTCRRPSRYSAAAIAKLPASACPREWLSPQPSHRRSLLSAGRGGPQQAEHDAAATTIAVIWMLASIGTSLLLGAAFLRLLRRHTEQAVRLTMVLQVCVWAGARGQGHRMHGGGMGQGIGGTCGGSPELKASVGLSLGTVQQMPHQDCSTQAVITLSPPVVSRWRCRWPAA